MTEFTAKWDARGLFVDDAELYDSTVEWIVPYYRKMHELLLKLAVESSPSGNKTQGRPLIALDIGSGTGADAMPLLQAIPHLHLVGVDFSAAMNKVFAHRATKSSVSTNRFHLMQADILDSSMPVEIPHSAAKAFGGAKFQIVTSAFTLHHFTKDQKASVFRLIYDLLEPGGVFLLGDLFNYEGESAWLTKTVFAWETSWFANNFDQAAKNAEDCGDFAKRDALMKLKDKWLRHYSEENAMDGVTTQLNMLKEVGFQEAGNPFRYWQMGLIFAKKPGQQNAN